MELIFVDSRDRKPIYEQLIDNIKGLVLRGLLGPDAQLPSVRALAGELAINPNTIQKAYTELERDGVIYSLPGRGRFVSPDTAALRESSRRELLRQCGELLARLYETGVTVDDVLELINKLWRRSDQ